MPERTRAERIAIELMNSVQRALDAGTKHYDIHGRPLLTVKDILEALHRDKRIEIKERLDA